MSSGFISSGINMQQYCREQVSLRINEKSKELQGDIVLYETDTMEPIRNIYNKVFPSPSLTSRIKKIEFAKKECKRLLSKFANTEFYTDIDINCCREHTQTYITFPRVANFIHNPIYVSIALLVARLSNRYINTLSTVDDITQLDFYGPSLYLFEEFSNNDIDDFYNACGTYGNLGLAEFLYYQNRTKYGIWYNYTGEKTNADHYFMSMLKDLYYDKQTMKIGMEIELPFLKQCYKQTFSKIGYIISKINMARKDIYISAQEVTNNEAHVGRIKYKIENNVPITLEKIKEMTYNSVECVDFDNSQPGCVKLYNVPLQFCVNARLEYYKLIKAINLIAITRPPIKTVRTNNIPEWSF
jgi:hypothetical protein